ncbi:tripartite tricarboxylate transporter substrate binding protein [Aquabacterium sp. J223]|uniref:Bug family tripartite tricarboxylate transporter substrate binding protein n=1 Tax=Aquabacterium sp. J223 TaxID=2898431 RepID=UPI0021ADCE9F|nr:tripartite tricarboxylate transporter substrate binding protein [Aquabacterium sp. J223]UUX97102.1 tripartite tricarboxylate transporter substrate binding protein [Aquabacterium sp. J223]
MANTLYTWTRRAALVALAGMAASSAAVAQGAYPTKPVTIVVAFPPGGMTDIVGRLVGEQLSQKFKQTFIVENRAGAAGQVGTEYVAGRPADGYTLLISATGHVIGPALQKVRYDPVKSFEPVAVLARAPNLFVVNPTVVPAKSFAELQAWGKTQQGIPYSTAGAGGSTHLAGELLRHLSGLPLNHVPYRGAAPGTQAVLAGEVPVAFQDSMSAASFIAAGKLRALAVTTAERSKLFPELPTLTELGFKNFDVYTWLGLYAPAGTPRDVVERLSEEVNRIMTAPDTVAKLKAQNAEAAGTMNPTQMRRFVETEVAKWRQTVEVTGVKTE